METGKLIKLMVNGMEKTVYVRHADTLLYLLREKLGFSSVKSGCNNGDCGSCTVLVDGKPLNACHMLAIEAVDCQVTTIDGLLDKTMSNSFIANWAIQCGFCSPGFILNCHALVEQFPNADDEMIDEWLDSNICRCTGYEEIKQSVKDVLQMRRIHDKSS